MADFRKFGQIMIDLETLSTHTDASIIEIGAVEFNKYTGDIGETFDLIIKPDDWGKFNRHIDGNTIQWWFSQNKDARERFLSDNNETFVSLKEALYKLSDFILRCGVEDGNAHNKVTVWGNGATMDITILQNAYEYFDIKIPWSYWSVNDVRTIVDLNPKIKKNCIFDSGIKHSAVADCLHEIKYLTETIKTLHYNKNRN